MRRLGLFALYLVALYLAMLAAYWLLTPLRWLLYG